MTERAVRAYLADTLTGHTSLLVAATNQHAAELSHRIRAELVRSVTSMPVCWVLTGTATRSVPVM